MEPEIKVLDPLTPEQIILLSDGEYVTEYLTYEELLDRCGDFLTDEEIKQLINLRNY